MLDFPTPTSIGQVYAGTNGVTYIWTGTLWLASGASAGGDFCASGTPTFSSAAAFVPVLTTVISGNATASYSTSNGRWTPPAGRYCFYAYWSHSAAAGSTQCFLLPQKNGVTITSAAATFTPPAANMAGEGSFNVTVDANGTDFFNINVQATPNAGTAGSMVMGGYPISGIKGPPGDYPSGALFMYSEKVCVGGETFMDVTIPANCKRIELDYSGAAAAGDPTTALQTVVSGTPNAGNNHVIQKIYANGTTPAGDQSTTNYWNVGGVAHCTGLMQFRNHSANSPPWAGVPNIWSGTASFQMISSAANRYLQVYAMDGGASPATTTGFRVTLASSSFMAGSFLRAYVVL